MAAKKLQPSVLTEESLEMTQISLALPKGRFLPNSLRVLESMSAEIADHARRLAWVVHVRDFSLTVKLLKAPDIANLLAAGEVDFGVLPDEWVREHHAEPPVELLDLRWCTSRIVLAGEPDHFDLASRAPADRHELSEFRRGVHAAAGG